MRALFDPWGNWEKDDEKKVRRVFRRVLDAVLEGCFCLILRKLIHQRQGVPSRTNLSIFSTKRLSTVCQVQYGGNQLSFIVSVRLD